jgi:cytochrome P450
MVAAALRSHEQGRDDQEPGVPNASSRTLLSRLVDECAVLSETEIQDNLHSALLAGYQASAVLTAFVLLELASRPNLQVLFLVCYPHSLLIAVS